MFFFTNFWDIDANSHELDALLSHQTHVSSRQYLKKLVEKTWVQSVEISCVSWLVTRIDEL